MKTEQSNPEILSKVTKDSINKIYNITMQSRQIMKRVQSSMHEYYDKIIEEKVHSCIYCPYKFKGKQIGAHYRNKPECKYMKDRPWLTVLPLNWKQDLQQFRKENQALQ